MDNSKLDIDGDLIISVPQPHATQMEVLKNARRFNVLACGRRWGKDTLIDHICIRKFIEGAKIAFLLPREIDSSKIYERHKLILSPLFVAGMVRSTHDPMTIRITGKNDKESGEMRYYTARNYESIRGSSLDIFAANEAGELATMIDLRAVWERTVRPTLLDRKGSAWFAGTPKGINSFYHLYQRGMDNKRDWRSFNYSTFENPIISKDEIETMIEDEQLSRRAIQQEIYAQFIDNGGTVFQNIDKVCILAPRSPSEIPASTCVIGIDIGGTVDYTALSVMSTHTSPIVEYALYRWHIPQIKRNAERIVEICSEWKPIEIVVETNSVGEYFYQELLGRMSKMPTLVSRHNTNASTKSDMIFGLQHALETMTLLLTVDAIGIEELSAYESKQTERGAPKFGAPRGVHDDTIIARSLAYIAARRNAVGALPSQRAEAVRFVGSPKLGRSAYASSIESEYTIPSWTSYPGKASSPDVPRWP